MSFQNDPSDEARPATRRKPGWTKLAVAAAAVVVVGGLAFGAERGGILSTSRVSWMESGSGNTPAATTGNAVTGVTGSLPGTDKLPVVPEVTSAAKSVASSLPKMGTKCDTIPTNPTCVCPSQGDCLTGVAVGAVNKVTAAVSVNLNTAVTLVSAAKVTVLGVPEKALEWKDKLGLNVALVTKDTVKDTAGSVVKVVYRVYVCSQLGTTVKLIGKTVQEGPALGLNLLQIKDINQDGIAEVVVGLVSEAKSKLTPVTMTLHDLVGGKDLTVQGTGLPETVVSALSPAQLLALPTALLAPVISSVPLASDWPTGSYTDSLGIINQFLH